MQIFIVLSIHLYLFWKFADILEMPSLSDLVVKLQKQVDRLSNSSGLQNNSIPAQESRPSSSQSSQGSSSNCTTDSDVESEQLVSISKVDVWYCLLRSQSDDLVQLCKYFRVHWLWKQSISKEMNNDKNVEFAYCRAGYATGYCYIKVDFSPVCHFPFLKQFRIILSLSVHYKMCSTIDNW
jgi:hypothetical protein